MKVVIIIIKNIFLATAVVKLCKFKRRFRGIMNAQLYYFSDSILVVRKQYFCQQ